ncbi:hypothetical protein NQ315_012144 [Exocentrus adspersus]|uniref:NADH dehydrogenase [ubiquinone] 1 beta subcomplex subunit 2, mitochondrial n=1 Tax=Exocentrus adspersus TaxID=1586481 RepID=A0AAV8VY62_9CUCU|nr:hypothetical protein NQ315_012144 [Exocentrus adspersus]
MLLSRGLPVLKNINSCLTPFKQAVRNSSHQWNYRRPPPPPPKENVLLAELVQGFAWWWVLWHLWTEPGHVFGEYEQIEPSTWTDEELGIPS